MKWTVRATASHLPDSAWCVMWNERTIYRGTLEECENIAAAHNAVIDMAFDSPGNVS